MLSPNKQCQNEFLSCKHLSSYQYLTELNLSNLKLLKIDQFPFEQFPKLHSLDLSSNELTSINPDWSKSFENSIEYLNLSHNKLQTLLFLKDFKYIKTLNITENLLLNNERFLSLFICPTLEHIIDFNEEQISIDQQKLNQLLSLINDSNSDSRQLIIKTIEKKKLFSQFHLSPLGNYFLRKIINLPNKSPTVFQPIKFLRSHHQSTNDLLTISVHGCAFQPNTTNLLATCGGQKVCFIDCNTCEITHLFEVEMLQKNKKQTKGFSCLCWIEIENLNILAVGATSGDIYLLSPKWKVMFGHIQLPNSSISCLTWHSNNPFTLVIGSYHLVRFINIRSYIDRLQSFIRKQNKPKAQFDYDDSSMFINKVQTTHIYNLYSGDGPLIVINDLLVYNNVLLVGTTSGLFLIKQQEKSPIQIAFPQSIWTNSEHIKSLRVINHPISLIAMNILNLDHICCFDLEQCLKQQQLHLILCLPNPYQQMSTKITLFSIQNKTNESFECIIGSNHGSFFYHQIELHKTKKLTFENKHQFELSWPSIESSPSLPNILSINLNEHYLCLTTNNNLICIYKRQ